MEQLASMGTKREVRRRLLIELLTWLGEGTLGPLRTQLPVIELLLCLRGVAVCGLADLVGLDCR